MKTNELDRIKAAFDRAIETAPDAETADKRRLLKAYFTDPAFRAAMADMVAEINGLR